MLSPRKVSLSMYSWPASAVSPRMVLPDAGGSGLAAVVGGLSAAGLRRAGIGLGHGRVGGYGNVVAAAAAGEQQGEKYGQEADKYAARPKYKYG